MANCFFCGKKLEQFKASNGAGKIGITVPENTRTKDHLHPRFNGGTDHPSNLVWACPSCNREKGNLSVEEYRAAMAYRHGLFWMEQHKRFSFWGERSFHNKAFSVYGLQAKLLWQEIREKSKNKGSNRIASLFEIAESKFK